jgi:phospho-N-acetylmuramoyl-pentapeptide-transferase
MIELLVYLLRELGVSVGFFRLLDYLTFRIIMAALTALAISLMMGHRTIVWLFRRRFRDAGGELASIKADDKRGTPTGGGILILLSVTIGVLTWARLDSVYCQAATVAFLYFGGAGWFDDALKVRFKSSLFGLGQVAKTVLQLAFVVPFALWLGSSASPLPPGVRTAFFVPFVKAPLFEMGPWLFAAWAAFVFYSIVNAVNFTDGLDGLATGPAAMNALLFAVVAWALGNAVVSRYLLFTYLPGAGELAVFAGALLGGLVGFLWFNAYPAEVFMGDTGSQAIGAALAAMVLLTRHEVTFVIAGGVFVANAFASLLQEKVGMRLGRRLLYRAPLNHGQVERGIAEPKVVVRFWIITTVLVLIAALSLKLR